MSGDGLPAGETGLLRCRGPGVCSDKTPTSTGNRYRCHGFHFTRTEHYRFRKGGKADKCRPEGTLHAGNASEPDARPILLRG